MKKRVVSYTIISLFFMMMGFFYRYHVPQAKTWLIVKIADLSQKYLEMKIAANDVDIALWPFGITLQDVTILPRGELAKKLGPVRAKSLGMGVSILSLVTGKKNLYWFKADEPKVTVILKGAAEGGAAGGTGNGGAPKFQIPTKAILAVPVNWLQISKMTFRLRSDDARLVSEVKDINLEAEHEYTALTVSVSTPQLNIKQQDLGSAIAQVAVEGRVILEPNALQISNLKIQRRSSTIVGTGLIEGQFEKGEFNKISLKGRGRVHLRETKRWVQSFFPDLNLPKLAGTVDAQFEIDRDEGGKITGNTVVETWNFDIDKFKIDRVLIDAAYRGDQVSVKKLEVKNKAGSFSIENVDLKLGERLLVSGDVKIPGLELAQLLAQLGLKKPDLHLMMSGDLPCKGELKPAFLLSCQGTVHGSDFEVYDDDDGPKNMIVKLKKFHVTGSVTVDKEAVRPKADLFVGTSKGKAEGRVEFKKGFWFSYQSPEIHFSDVEDLASLDLEGHAEVNGTTSGNSDFAVINMKVGTKDLWMSDFAIGDATGDVSYKAGDLFIKEVAGRYRSSRYTGETTVHLRDKSIDAHFKIPFAEAYDLQLALERKAKLPFMASGPGSGWVNVSGPLEFTQLTYDLQSHFTKGVIAGEIYDHAYFNVHAKRGHVVADRAEITRAGGAITLVGDGYPDGNISTTITGKGLMLETFDLFSDMPLSFSGLLGFSMKMKGHVFSPTIDAEGSITQTSISQQNVGDSSFQFQLNSNTLQGKGNVFGQTIKSDFIYPLKDGHPFRLDLATNKWNFAPFLAFISGNARQQGYDTDLTSSFRLESPRGGIAKASGKIEVQTFRVRRGSLEMANPQPLRVNLREGVIGIDQFYIQGGNTQLTAESRATAGHGSQVLLTGTVDMSLLAFLTPFLQEMRGIFSISSQIRLEEDRFEILGSGFISRGYIKLKEFPHPVEQLKADFLFSQKKIIINSFTGLMAGGRISTDGTIQVAGYKDFPTQIQMRLDEVTLKVPDGVSTNGSANLSFTGNWFPFLMAGTYTIREGLMDRPFEKDEVNAIRRSTFLPKMILQDTFEPIRMDIETVMLDTFKVKNPLVDAQFTGNLKIKGTPNAPVLLGEIRAVRGGHLYFRETPFEILTGIVKFDNAQEINPVMYVTAQSRVQAVEYNETAAQASGATDSADRKRTRQYEVNLLLQGTQKNARITLTSQPPLEESDIISLLALGITTQQLERRQATGEDQVTETGVALLSQNLKLKTKWVDVRVAGASSADDTRVGDSKVVMSRQWTPKMTTSVSRTILTNKTEANVRYQLNDSLSALFNWEGRQYGEEEKEKARAGSSSDTFGVGLEYGVEFK
ncbi:MAG: translocation/assembly module TamB domain-containing protein [Bdellovibrionia bacterium]